MTGFRFKQLGLSLIALLSSATVYCMPANLMQASHIVSSSSATGHEAPKAVDNNLNTYWQASVNGPQWLEADLQKPCSISKIVQVFNKPATWKYKIEGSLDKNSWLTVIDQSDGVRGAVFAKSVTGIYRYIRLTVLGSSDGNPPSSKEFTITGTDCIELGENAKITSGQGINPLYEPEKACDGNTSTYWCATGPDYPQFLTADLRSVCEIKSIRQIFKDNDQWKFRIQGSLDGNTWNTILDNNKGETGHDFTVTCEDKFRYIRLVVLGSSSGFWASSAELKIYGLPEGKTIEDYLTRELSKNTQATASSIKHKNQSQYKALDGDDNTAWQADEKADGAQWLEVDLGNPCLLSGIEQTFPDTDIWSFEVEGSNDKTVWTGLWQESESEGRNFTSAVDGIFRYVRLTVSGSRNKHIAGSSGFKIFGTGSPVNAYWWEETSGFSRYYNKVYDNKLADITADLDNLKAQGFRILEFSTIYEGKADIWAGLGATDNYAIEPSLGTMEDFEKLIAEAHKRNMKIILFGNLGYCRDEAPFFQKACEDYKNNVYSKERYWFHFSDQKHDDKWFWSEKAGAYYFSYWGNTDGAAGRIPSYNFRNQEWRDEAVNYLNFWSQKGLDGFFLDAPEVYDGITGEMLEDCIVKQIMKYGMLMNAEGSGDINRFIANHGFNCIQGFDLYGWGGNKRSEVLNCLRRQNPGGLDEKLKSYRDYATAVRGITLTPPMWEIPTTIDERIFETAFLTTTGTLFANHFGDHRYLAQDIIANWKEKDQERFFDLIRIQNNYSALAPVGQRVKLSTNDDKKYLAFKRCNKDGNVSALIIMNFQNKKSKITVNLKNTGIKLQQIPVDLLTGTAADPISSTEYTVTLPAQSYLILGVENQHQDRINTGLTEQADPKKLLKVHPNPFKNVLTIESETTIKQVSAYSVSGNRLQEYTVNDKAPRLNFETLESGTYLLKIVDINNDVQSVKIVKI